MYTKNRKLGVMLLVGALAVATVVSIGWYVSRPQSQALAVNQGQSPEAVVQETVTTNPVEADKQADIRSKTINGITVEITSAKLIETGIEVGVCYSTPDGGDWYPLPGSISYSTYEILPDEFEFTSEEKADGKKLGERCVLIRYRMDDLSNILTPIQFSLTGLSAVPKELPPCEDLQQRLNTSPRAQALGLKARCSYDEQTGISVTLSEKAASVAQGKAQQVLDEVVKGEVNGPWEFLITEIEK